MSIDGYIASENGSVQWLDSFTTTQEDYGYDAFYKSISTVVMGSTTYQQTLTFGPYPYKDKHSYVFSHQRYSDKNVHVVQGDVKKVLSTLDPKEHPHIWIVGGAQLIEQCMHAGAIDEYRLFVMPVLLGTGIRLFNGIGPSMPCTLLNQTKFASGVVELHYKPKG